MNEDAPQVKPVEAWAVELATPAWALAAAKAHHGWVDGEELGRREYAEKIKETTGMEVR